PPTHMLEKLGGFLSAPAAGNPLEIARQYLSDHAADLGLNAADITNAIVTDQYTDDSSGITHIYLRQTLAGVPIIGADMSVHVMSDGRMLGANSSFMAGLKAIAQPAREISPQSALSAAAAALDLNSPELSLDPIHQKLQYYPT